MATVEEIKRDKKRVDRAVAALRHALASVETSPEPALARSVQAEKNLYERVASEFGLYTASEMGEILGSRSLSPRNLAAAARREGRLLAIERGSRTFYPGFCVNENGRPLEVVAKLIELGNELDRSETGVVQWLVSPTTYLNGFRPVDVLRDEPDRVLDVARNAWGVSW